MLTPPAGQPLGSGGGQRKRVSNWGRLPGKAGSRRLATGRLPFAPMTEMTEMSERIAAGMGNYGRGESQQIANP